MINQNRMVGNFWSTVALSNILDKLEEVSKTKDLVI